MRHAIIAFAALASASTGFAQQPAAPAAGPADAIFLDHPSMDRNATVMPAPDAEPVSSIFKARPLLDASIARTAGGTWLMTGTAIREGKRDGIELWRSDDGESWMKIGTADIRGPGIDPASVADRYVAPSVHVSGERIYLAFADETGCARVATGSLAAPKGPYRASGCLVDHATDVSLFVDDDGTAYLLWGGGHIAKLMRDLEKLAEPPRFLKPDQTLFAKHPPVGKDWPVRTHVGRSGATMIKHRGKYVLAASEVTGRLRTATEDLFVAEAPSPYGPFTRRALAVPHAGQSSLFHLADGTLAASYNPRCEDEFALFCEQVGVVPLERAPDGRLRQAASVITEDSAVAARRMLVASETMRDPSVAVGHDGHYYLVGTLNGYGYQQPEGGVKLWRSRDLRRWEEQGFIFEWRDMGYAFQNVAELWAPEIRYVARDRTYYLAFSVMERGVGGKTWLYRSTSGKAQGPYENVKDGYFVEGIDGFPFEDESGFYLLWGGGNIGKLNARRDGFDGPVTKLVDSDGDHVGYEGNGLIKVGDTYFLTGAEWHGPLRTHGTYDMMYGTSKSLLGPYSQRRMGAPHGGHGTPFKDREGRFWYTMFGNDPTAPWRMHFGLIPIEISDETIRVPRIGEAARD